MVNRRMRPLGQGLTEEDRAAWFDWQINHRRDFRLWAKLEDHSFVADHRDADLMLSLEYHRAMRAPAQLIRAGQLCGYGGPFQAFVNLPSYDPSGNITNYA